MTSNYIVQGRRRADGSGGIFLSSHADAARATQAAAMRFTDDQSLTMVWVLHEGVMLGEPLVRMPPGVTP